MGKNVRSLNELVLPAKDYVLVLPGWYPTWLDPMPGDFNQRHVKAAGLYKPQVVLYVGKDQSNSISNIQVRYNQVTEQVLEIIVLYPAEKVKAWDVVQSNIQFVKLLYKYAQLIEQRFGKPQLLHAYIVLRGGLAAYLLQKKWHVPYVLTENWTIYYPEDPGYYKKRNILFRTVVRRVFKNASRFLPVTKDLQLHAEKLFGSIPSTVIPNVVQTDRFNYTHEPPQSYFRFVHISTMEYQKNAEGLLRAFAKFSRQMPGAQLWMVGPYPEQVKAYATTLSLDDLVHFTGPVNYHAVADILHQSHALVLFSRYENLPCVILESHCCGLPVISTAVGGIAEVIDDSNGLLIESENETELLSAMEQMIRTFKNYQPKKIAETAIDRFSYAAVGSSINRVYDEIVGN
jgi:glycosyltransferase involved in cell wall biosynthesis